MQDIAIRTTLAIACASAGVLFAACNDDGTSPARQEARPSAALVAEELPAFLERAPLEPFFINQPSQMMIRTDAPTDFVIQRVVGQPGPGGWHTHTGPSFGIVKVGTVTITRWSRKNGCVSTTYQTGQAYYEVAGEVHRATVEGGVPAVEYKARFYAPVNGGSFTTFLDPNDAPDCGTN